ncbi:MAG: type II secretion system protein F [Ruminococcus sp.]|nr:type II secretion system protein F [Ruminococcus sp.]
MLSYLFYNTWIAVIFMIPVSIFYFHQWREDACRKKEQEFREQFQNGMQTLASALKVGYSVENAIRETEKDLRTLYPEDSRIIKEFSRMIHELDVNFTAEQVLKEMAARICQEDVENFVTVFATAKRTGGDSIAFLKSTVKIIGDKIEVEREIQTLLSAKKLEFHVMCIIPLGMVLYMRMAFPEFLSVLYGGLPGIILMTICLSVYAFAWRLGRKMIQIEV